MSALERQVIQSIHGQPEGVLLTVLSYLKNNPSSHRKGEAIDRTRMTQSGVQRIGIAENEHLFEDDYDFDSYDGEIAKLFGAE